jgi:hypothetical protein
MALFSMPMYTRGKIGSGGIGLVLKQAYTSGRFSAQKHHVGFQTGIALYPVRTD